MRGIITAALLLISGFCSFKISSAEFHFVNVPMNYTSAQSYCREEFSDLATVGNSSEERRVAAVVPDGVVRTWIGLRLADTATWYWARPDHTLVFLNWEEGEPNATTTPESCGAMNSDGRWFESGCDTRRGFVCGGNDTHRPVFVADKKSWRRSQDHCRGLSRELVSVRSAAENIAVRGELTEAPVWIGLFKDRWRWSDGDGSSFRLWKTNQPSSSNDQNCVVAVWRDGGRWNDLKCQNNRKFVCQGARKINPRPSPAIQQTAVTPGDNLSSPVSQQTAVTIPSSPVTQQTAVTPGDNLSSSVTQQTAVTILSSTVTQQTAVTTLSSTVTKQTAVTPGDNLSSTVTQQTAVTILSSPVTQQTAVTTLSSPVSQVTLSSPVTQQNLSSPVTQQHLSSPVTQQHLSTPGSQQTAVTTLSTPGSQQTAVTTLSSPVTQQTAVTILSSPVTQQNLSSPVTQQNLSSPVTQQTVTAGHIFSSPVTQSITTQTVFPVPQADPTTVAPSPVSASTATTHTAAPARNVILIQKNMSWMEAWSYCRTHHTALVSVHSEELQARVGRAAENATSPHVWLGLRHAFNFWYWIKWGDGCYQNWAPGHGAERTYDCGMAGALEATRGQQWVALPDTEELNFICLTCAGAAAGLS
ncbi:unnamed protein product [Boreogadus saida]